MCVSFCVCGKGEYDYVLVFVYGVHHGALGNGNCIILTQKPCLCVMLSRVSHLVPRARDGSKSEQTAYVRYTQNPADKLHPLPHGFLH